MDWLEGLKDFFMTGNPITDKPVTHDDLKKAYGKRTPIAGYLPWLDIVEDDKILLEDARSVAAVFEIKAIPTEARSADFLVGIRNQIRDFIGGAFEELTQSPWIVQVYAWQDRESFRLLPDRVLKYAKEVHAKRDQKIGPFTQFFVDKVLRPHVDDMCMKGGLFKDPLANDRPWGGATRKVYMVCYRRQGLKAVRRKDMTPEKELDNQCKRVMQTLRTAGVHAERLKGETIRNWLFRWFNPNPKQTQGDLAKWLGMNPYARTEDDKAADFDLANDVMTRDVRSDKKTQCWFFDGQPHTVLSLERMSSAPKIGQVSAERYVSESEISGNNARTTCLIDELPENSIVIINYVIKPQATIRRHLEKLAKNSRGDTPEARATREEVEHSRLQIARGNKLYPFSMGIALCAPTLEKLDDVILETDTLLAANGLQVIEPEDDLIRLDRYIRFLPCAYDPSLDQVGLRERVIYANHLANILPFYGRSTGTGNPAFLGFNRGGEAFTCDPLKQGDRAKNAHLFLFGPTGAGKSATLVYLMMMFTAVYDPRWVVVEAGNSFGLLLQFLKKCGKKTHDIILRPGQAPSIPPFKPALELVTATGEVIQDYTHVEAVLVGDAPIEAAETGDTDDDDEQVQRDILGEMLILARLMVTGAEAQEEARMSRADVGLLKAAIINAAKAARKAKKNDVLTEDVINALLALREERPDRTPRINEMAEAMSLFTDGFSGELFNRPGEDLPDADYIRIEMGALASGNDTNDKLSVAYIAIVNQVIARAQRTQRDGRPTINLTDEAHVITTNPLLAHYLVVVSKLLGRRMGLWLWQATQNMKDYTDASEKMLAMFEWWLCLKIDEGELKNIEKFKALNPDQRQMLLSTQKVSGKYTEGVVMSDNVQGLFRVVQPGLCLALALTEKEEKRDRFKLMKQHNIDETEAAMMIGKRINEARRAAAMAES